MNSGYSRFLKRTSFTFSTLTSPCEWHLGRSATQVKVTKRTAAPFPILRASLFTNTTWPPMKLALLVCDNPSSVTVRTGIQ